MFKQLVKAVIFLCLFKAAAFAQDTISVARMSMRTPDMSGDYVVMDVYASIITTYYKEGQYITDTIKNSTTHYQRGKLNKGLKQGTWFTYKKGKADTLFAMAEWNNDTLLEQTNYYPNGNPQVKYTYHKYVISTETYYVADGRKYMEYNYLSCVNRFTEHDMVYMDYHSNGLLRSVGKVHIGPHIKPENRRYGTWYFYNRKGKLWQKTDYDKIPFDTKNYRRKGQQYQWFETKY